MQQNLSQFVPALVLAAIIIGFWILHKRKGEKQKGDDLAILCRYFEDVNAMRSFRAAFHAILSLLDVAVFRMFISVSVSPGTGTL
jgi:hypothetical protein